MPENGDLKLTEERLARASVLQELTVAALDLFDPRRPMDDFLDRLAVRLGCLVALCLTESEPGALRLTGAAGLSRTSRALALPAVPASAEADLRLLELPFPELAGRERVAWQFRISTPEGPGRRLGSFLLLIFEGPPRLPAQYHGVVERLAEILRTALLHRRLFAQTIESERVLLEQKTLLECQTEASPDAILVISADGAGSANRRFGELFGSSGGERRTGRDLLRQLASRVAYPSDAAEQLERLLDSREPATVPEMRLLDGRELEATAVPIRSRDGVHYGRGYYFRDVTHRRHAEQERALLLQQEKLARSQAEDAEKRAAFLAEASRMLAASLDYPVTLERIAHLALPTFADWCSVDIVEDDHRLDRVAVTHIDPSRSVHALQLKANHPPDPARPTGIGRVLRTGEPALYINLSEQQLAEIAQDEEHLRLLRELKSESAIIVPLVARGRMLGAISLVYGTSGRRYGPADLAVAEDLAYRAALAVDNARLYRRLQEAVRARDEFLSIASHELRTPITSLQLAAQGLLRLSKAGNLGKAPEGFIDGSLETAVRQTGRMAELIDKLLDVSRIQADRLELTIEEVDLGQVVQEIAAQTAPELGRAGCNLTIDLPGPVVGRWDRARLESVVANLLSNAMKYGARQPIEIRVEGDGAVARLTVRDHGIGIPAEAQQKIFERFERAVSARHYSGLGLGLYIVRRVLESLGGTIRVQSVPGEGATFVVELPRAGADLLREAPGAGDSRGAA